MSKNELNNENNISASIKNPKVIKVVLLLLFILSFFTIYMALALVSATTNATQGMTENMWLFFLPLPIPLASLILGIIYKKKGFKATKNIVVGIIFTVLLIIYGSFTFIFSDMYSHDFSYVNRVGASIGFDLPDKGDIATEDWTGGTQTGTQANVVKYHYMSDITFTDKSQVSKFNSEISDSELWLPSVRTSLMGLIPSMYSDLTSSAEYDYFMIYNADLKSYNTIPESSGTYRYLFIAYNSLEGTMKIIEYSLVVLV